MSFTIVDGIKKQVPNHEEILNDAKEKVYQWVQGELDTLSKNEEVIKGFEDFYRTVVMSITNPDPLKKIQYEGSITKDFKYDGQYGVFIEFKETPADVIDSLKIIFLLETDWKFHFNNFPSFKLLNQNGVILLDINFTYTTIWKDDYSIAIRELNPQFPLSEQIV